MIKKIAIIGLGYVGLPLAALCANKGFEVIGFDLKKEIVEKTNKRHSHIKDKRIQISLDTAGDILLATTDPNQLSDCNIFIVCVPTPIDNRKQPDLLPLKKATETISKYLKKADLVIIESTVFPGTCEEIVLPILENTGLKAGTDFYLVHCPERINPGDVFWHTENIPRVIGGISKEGTDEAANFYGELLGGLVFDVQNIKKKLRPKIIPEELGYRINTMPLGSITKMNSIRDAEAVKAMENTVRDVNIAFVNELAKISDVLNLDVVDIINGMSTKPFGKGPFFPGIGVGGHCIAVDPEWLKAASMKAGFFPNLIQMSRDTNNSMPDYAVNLLKKRLLNEFKESKICVFGVTYKGNIDDPRESPFFEVKKILEINEIVFDVFDPLYTGENTVNSFEEALKDKLGILLVTDHSLFKETLIPEYLKEHGIKFVIDGRNCLDKKGIEKEGIIYQGLGR